MQRTLQREPVGRTRQRRHGAGVEVEGKNTKHGLIAGPAHERRRRASYVNLEGRYENFSHF